MGVSREIWRGLGLLALAAAISSCQFEIIDPLPESSLAGAPEGPGQPAQLVFKIQPSGLSSINTAFASQPAVAVLDADGVTVTDATHAVALAPFIDSSCTVPAEYTLITDANPVTAIGGVATFSGVMHPASGTIYLKASAAGLRSACSAAVRLTRPIPGVIRAEYFDEGGAGVAYSDSTDGNNGLNPPGRLSEDVDINYNSSVSAFVPGEWMQYTVNVQNTASYTIQTRFASEQLTGDARIRYELDGVDVSGSISLPNTGNWELFKTHKQTGVLLTAGAHTLRVVIEASSSGWWGSGGFSLAYAQFYEEITAPSSPYSGTPIAVPGTIQAEHYDLGGIDVAYYDTTAGNSGYVYSGTPAIRTDQHVDINYGWNVTGFEPGEWLNYSVDVASTANYTLQIRYASQQNPGDAVIHVEVDGVDVTGPVSLNPTGSWDLFKTQKLTGIPLTAGNRKVRLVVDASSSGWVGAGGFSIDYLHLYEEVVAAPAPYSGTPIAVPGTIQAEHYDLGGIDVAYYDTTAGNSGYVYSGTPTIRTDQHVDINYGWNVTGFEPGEWLNYSVDVASTASYTFQFRYASQQNPGEAVIHVEIDGIDVTGPISLAPTGSWDLFKTHKLTGISLAAGAHDLRVVVDASSSGWVGAGGFSLDYIQIYEEVVASSTPYGGAPVSLPGRIEAEYYDLGGIDVAYYDTTAGNSGYVYSGTPTIRTDQHVDINYGWNVTGFEAGEWLKYSVDVPTGGTFNVTLRYACNQSLGDAIVHLEVDGIDVTGPISLIPTGSWDTFATQVVTGVNLTTGPHVLRVVVDSSSSGWVGAGGFSIDYFDIQP